MFRCWACGFCRGPVVVSAGVPARAYQSLGPASSSRLASTRANASQSVRAPNDTDLAVFSTYRSLLRRTPASVRFNKAASKNLRRLLRDEAQALLLKSRREGGQSAHSKATSEDAESRLHDSRVRTLALLLASSHSPRRKLLYLPPPGAAPDAAPTPTSADNAPVSANAEASGDANALYPGRMRQTLAHRLVANLASLTYHHLSPYTRMQPLSNRRAATERNAVPVSALARMLNKTDNSASDWLSTGEEGVMNATADRLDILRVPPKPVRGPVGAKPSHWDPQNPDKLRPATQDTDAEGGTMVAEKDIERLQAGLHDVAQRKQHLLASADAGERETKARIARLDKQEAQMQSEIVKLRSKVKTVSRRAAKADQTQRVRSIAIDMLADLVAQAQINEDMWIGKSRWETRKRGGWLPP